MHQLFQEEYADIVSHEYIHKILRQWTASIFCKVKEKITNFAVKSVGQKTDSAHNKLNKTVVNIKNTPIMKSSVLKIFSIILLFTVLFACKTTDNLTYFKNSDQFVSQGETVDYALKLQPSDELVITVNSLVPEATAPYNLPLVNPAKEGEVSMSSSPQNQTYVIDTEGYIDFPLLGKIQATGKTTEQLADLLEEKIAKEVDEPAVKVKLVNFKVNVLGEVTKPGAIEVKSERFSVLDAIAAAEDLTIYGERHNVLLIRENNGKKEFHRLDLADAGIVESPYFYMQQNDVIYVEPNKIRSDNSKYNQNNAFKVTVVSTVVSALSVIASLVIALTINNNK